MSRYNMSKSEAKKSGKKRYKISGGSSSKKKAKKKKKEAEKKMKKYYAEQEKRKKEEAARKKKRLAEDLSNVLKDAGVYKTRAIDDYIRNMDSIAKHEKADKEDLNYYLETARERTGEDLDTGLAKEARRYSIEYDRINQSLADAGLTFSERKEEVVAKEGSEMAEEAIERTAERSFQDIKRFEYEKDRNIEMKYSEMESQEKISKKRTLEDIVTDTNRAKTQINRGQEDVTFGLKYDLRDLEYEEDTNIALLDQRFDQFESSLDLASKRRDVQGY